MDKRLIRGRFAPSPSGEMHLGNAWVALLSWLHVRQADGVFVLRIEDLDPDRSREEYVEKLIEDLKWLGLDWDEGPEKGGKFAPYIQSYRFEYYNEALQKLTERDLVYPCFCSRKEIRAAVSAPHGVPKGMEYPNTCRKLEESKRSFLLQTSKKYSLRFKTPNETLKIKDLVYGEYTHNPALELGDFVIRRSDGVYAYQLAVVVDDALMEISHIVRGADLLHSTSRQILLYQALNYSIPNFAHVPLLIDQDGNRLAKRQASLSLSYLQRQEMKPEKVIGQLGYWAGLLEKPEPVKATDLIPIFDLNRLPKQDIVVNQDKLL